MQQYLPSFQMRFPSTTHDVVVNYVLILAQRRGAGSHRALSKLQMLLEKKSESWPRPTNLIFEVR